jgi:ubiquitin carboxyl-terminal hydrolase L5
VAQETDNETTEEPDGVWFANQTLANSCATVALMNIINNHAALNLGEKLNAFRIDTRDVAPLDRGLALDRFDFVRDIHNSFSTELERLNVDLRLRQDVALAEKKKKAAMVQNPRKKRKVEEEIEDENALHFVAYVPVAGAVWRMDGLESLPRRVGTVEDGDSWTAVVLPELQTQLEAASMEYSLLSLTAVQDGATTEADKEKMTRRREDWGPFLAQMMTLHAEKDDLRQMLE